MNQKWDIVTDAFNNGLQQSETNTYYSLDLPLEPQKHRTKEVIKHKFEDILSEFRSILLFQDLAGGAAGPPHVRAGWSKGVNRRVMRRHHCAWGRNNAFWARWPQKTNHNKVVTII